MAEAENHGFLDSIFASPVTAEICRRLSETRHVAATGQWGSCALALAAVVQKKLNRPMVIITAHLDEADDAIDQLSFFRKECRVEVFPAFEVLPGESNVSHELAAQRLEVLHALAGQGGAPKIDFVIAPIQALMQPSPNRDLLKEQMMILKTGASLDRDHLVRWLADHDYSRLEAVEDAGDFAVRGEIVDVWPPGYAEPVRVDFFGDQIETLSTFDIETLGTVKNISEARLVALGDRSTWPAEQTASFLSYAASDSVVWLVEPSEIQEQGRSYYDKLQDARGIYSPQAVFKQAQNFAWAEIHQFGHEDDAIHLPCRSVMRFDTKTDAAVAELAGLVQGTRSKLTAEEGEILPRVVVVCDSQGEVTRLRDILDVKAPGTSALVDMPVGAIGLGFEWNEYNWGARPEAATAEKPPEGTRPLILVGHHEIFHRYTKRRKLRGVAGARPIDSFLDLQTGDYVVHVHHGIAKFTGMTSITREGRQSEYLTLQFAGDATLQVPVTQIHLVQKYVGGAHGRPVLSVLGGTRWSKQKEEVAKAVEKMAGDLLEVQAAREHMPGTSYPPDTAWMHEFESAFPFTPTEDQVRCIGEIKDDLAKQRPMDRLLCGDVGYGKTELAIRAAFKVCEAGKQVAVLVPTTVLCEQHEDSFRQRMGDYPFVVESISRFKTAGQIKKILDRTRAGQVDILIGTHRLISKDVQFADLGLVIIDEEQRFGVEHKEKLKKLRLTVDVLTMTATPIPRTLHMSLLGIRDISNLATPPQDRRSVVTEVIPHDKARLKQALQREMARNGQVYYVHNRIHDIQSVADELYQLVPDARIVIGHGQMDPHELEEVMHKFIKHQADILVSTTIIESGIDIPNANTMFIDQAENYGLSNLHQLRGRVGRYKHRAYCYLLLSPDKTLSSTAAKRLKAMEEYASLGAGFKIALRDLEIRGAGNILGPEQSGHISAVGYEMYCQLLEEAVKKIKNQPIEKPKEVNVDIGITGVLPKSYVDSERQRMDLYRRMTRCFKLEDLVTLTKDITDAFGPPPKPVQTMLNMAELRVLAGHWGIVSIIAKDPDVIFTIEDFSKLGPLLGRGPGSVRIPDEKTVHLRLPKAYFEPETLLNVLRNMLNPNKPAEQPKTPTPQSGKTAPPKSPLGRNARR